MHVFTVLLVAVASLSHLYLGCCWHGGGPRGTVCTAQHQHAHNEHAVQVLAVEEHQPAGPSQEKPHRHHCSQHGRCWWSSSSRQQEPLQVATLGDRYFQGLLIAQQVTPWPPVPHAHVSSSGAESQAQLGVFLC